ncbi:hypothetical protein AVEN_38790-1 [Araneus ventricosus]|uniref:Uncharacterized protein n=1 Tax=Araneus ventricosus TaxID=182803 RepID=A0A4Y2Q7T6_ARAVE|nr:hypothetical protein AVEN_38790-1 [Araneus ventricosus]
MFPSKRTAGLYNSSRFVKQVAFHSKVHPTDSGKRDEAVASNPQKNPLLSHAKAREVFTGPEESGKSSPIIHCDRDLSYHRSEVSFFLSVEVLSCV